MKQKYSSMIYKLSIIFLFSFSLISCSVFLDPGGNRKYEIDVSEFQLNNKVNIEEENLFKEKYLGMISNELVKTHHGSGSFYNSKTKEKVANTVDTLLDVKVNYLIRNTDNVRSVYFITYLTGTYVIPNDSIKGQILNQRFISDAIYLNLKTNQAHIIKTFSPPYGYYQNRLFPDISTLSYSQKRSIQLIFIDYEYYTNRRKENPEFWNNILKHQTDEKRQPLTLP